MQDNRNGMKGTIDVKNKKITHSNNTYMGAELIITLPDN